MINAFAKSLVLLHTVLSVIAMGVAIAFVLQARDLGWREPYEEKSEKGSVRYASEYDRSVAAVTVAAETRNRAYSHVKPAIDSLRSSEPYLANNYLHYVAEMDRLRNSPDDKIDVNRFEKGGTILDTPGSSLGKPVLEATAIDTVTQSYRRYAADLKKLYEDIDKVDKEINDVVANTKKITAQMTGTDEANKYVHPGLYQLTDLEFKAQAQLKNEIDDIKPHWSKAVEQARLFSYRRADLEATLEKLKGALPPKDNKKK